MDSLPLQIDFLARKAEIGSEDNSDRAKPVG